MITLNQVQKRLNKGKNKGNVNFEKVDPEEVTEARAKAVVDRMRRAIYGERRPWWKRLLKLK